MGRPYFLGKVSRDLFQGTLIATVSPDRAEEALSLLKDKRIEARVIGRIEEGSGVYLGCGASLRKALQQAEDLFWPTFFRALDLARRGEQWAQARPGSRSR